MMSRRMKLMSLMGGTASVVALGGCSTVELEYSGPRSYVVETSNRSFGPGPSLVAGDQLAYRMVLAGAYDAPSVFDGTGFATVPVTDE